MHVFVLNHVFEKKTCILKRVFRIKTSSEENIFDSAVCVLRSYQTRVDSYMIVQENKGF